jgi:hypothetical protein
LGIDFTLDHEGSDGSGNPVWILTCRAMEYSGPTTNPTRDMLLLISEWETLMAIPSSMELEVSP